MDAYAELGILPPRDMLVRRSVCSLLGAARALLPHPFGLVVLDGYRPLAEQQTLVDHYAADAAHVAVVDADAMRPPHTTGGAVDLTLTWHGTPLALGTDYDDFTDAARLDAFEADGAPLIRRLRRMLANAMTLVGFAPYAPEWWHWSFGDDIWARHHGSSALYEIVEAQEAQEAAFVASLSSAR